MADGSITVTGTPAFLAVVRFAEKSHHDKDTRWIKFHLRGGEPDASVERTENIPIQKLLETSR